MLSGMDELDKIIDYMQDAKELVVMADAVYRAIYITSTIITNHLILLLQKIKQS